VLVTVLPRVPLAGLLGLVLVLALGIASLRFATTFWTMAATTVTLACLLAAILGAIYQRGSARAFCVGFALFGWAYLILVEWSWIGGQLGQDLTRGLSDLAETVHPPLTPTFNASIGPNARANLGARMRPLLRPDIEDSQRYYIKVGNFVQICRLSMSLAFAYLGGVIAWLMERWGRNDGALRRDEPSPV
jgi:hypothetical protein